MKVPPAKPKSGPDASDPRQTVRVFRWMTEASAKMSRMDHPGCEISVEAVISPDARIFASVRGTHIRIGAYSEVFEFAVLRAVGGSGDIDIGQHCQINPHCVLYSGNGIRLGDNVAVAPGVQIVPTNHGTVPGSLIRTQPFAPSRGGVVVEGDNWIGANSVLLDGAHIGEGSVIAAGSVVSGPVPPGSIWGGVPARPLKAR